MSLEKFRCYIPKHISLLVAVTIISGATYSTASRVGIFYFTWVTCYTLLSLFISADPDVLKTIWEKHYSPKTLPKTLFFTLPATIPISAILTYLGKTIPVNPDPTHLLSYTLTWTWVFYLTNAFYAGLPFFAKLLRFLFLCP